jgi:valyl-tRNA synthetase
VHHAPPISTAVTGQFADILAGLPTPLNHAQVVEVDDRDAAAAPDCRKPRAYAMDQDPTRLVYPVWRDPDVLDTWFSSGLWPIGTLGWPEDDRECKRYFPTERPGHGASTSCSSGSRG